MRLPCRVRIIPTDMVPPILPSTYTRMVPELEHLTEKGWASDDPKKAAEEFKARYA